MVCFSRIFSLLLFFSIFSLNASPYFDGNVRYQFSNNNSQVTLSLTKISNNEPDWGTGPLKVSLWATTSPYNGGQITGTRIAEFPLAALGPGQYWNAMNKTINATLPSAAGNYHMTMTLEEGFDEGWAIQHWVSFDAPAYLSRPAPPPKVKLKLEGPYKWQTHPSQGTITLKTGKISHNRNGKSGTLRVVAWATRQPYKGGTINGYRLGHIQRQPLQKGMIYASTSGTVSYTPPPSGYYFVTLTLSEYQSNGYIIMDYFTFDGTTYFQN